MTPQEWQQEVNGTLTAIVHACTSMIATHPEKQKVLELLQALSAQAIGAPEDTPETQHYKRGMQSAVSLIHKGVETARLAEEVLALKHQTGSH